MIDYILAFIAVALTIIFKKKLSPKKTMLKIFGLRNKKNMIWRALFFFAWWAMIWMCALAVYVILSALIKSFI